MELRRIRRWMVGALAPALLLGSPLARAAEQAGEGELPDWAAGFKDVWQMAKRNGALKLSARMSTGTVPAGRSEVFAVVEIQALDFPTPPRAPLNLGLVIDDSASMAGARLRTVKRVAGDLLSRLTEADRLTIIGTNTEAQTLPAARVTAANRARMQAFLDGLKAQGSSDLSVGFDVAVEQVAKERERFTANRIVLISDGRLTHGMNDPAGLAQIAKQVRQEQRIHVSAVAVGEEADRELMAGIAKEGWGFFEYVSDAARDPRMGKRLDVEGLHHAAERAELVVKLGKDVTLEDVFEHDELRTEDGIRIPLYEVGAGEQIRVVLRLSVSGATPGPLKLGKVELAYRDGLVNTPRQAEAPLAVEVQARKVAGDVDPEAMRLALGALVTRNIAWADEAAESGNVAQAVGLLDSARETVTKARLIAGLSAFAGELARLEEARDQLAPKKAKAKGGKRKKGKGR